MGTAEHIVLESEVRELPRLESPRKVHASVQCASVLRRQRLALSVIDFYYLAVRRTPGVNGVTAYLLDLRFVDPRFRMTRVVPWRCVCAALALTVAAAASIRLLVAETDPAARQSDVLIVAGLTASAVLAYVWVAVRLLETVTLHSLHGQTPVLEYRGRFGTLRRLRPFMRKLAAHVRVAAADRRKDRTEHLRDELREHHRLNVDGVLSDADYAASKARILAQHGGPAESSRTPRASKAGRHTAGQRRMSSAAAIVPSPRGLR